jgi:hypothetical protein
MRLRTDIWVSAFLRQQQTQGRYGAVLRKGAPEAGAVYVVIDRLDGTQRLHAPAPGPAYGENGERRFTQAGDPEPAQAVKDRLARQSKFDPDIWIVEIEERSGDIGLAA